ncbi:MAG: hypothetical protein ABJF63_04185, partial [Ekhidna sp.]
VTVEASDTSAFHIYTIGDKKVNVKVSNIRGKAISYIKDESGQILFEKKLKEEGVLNIIFDLANLSNGKYIFVVEDEFKRHSVPFELLTDAVEIYMEDSQRINFPQLIKDSELVLVKFLTNESNDLLIAIKTENGQLLFQERIEGKLGLIGKRFQFEPGEYLVTLSCNDYTETKYLSF